MIRILLAKDPWLDRSGLQAAIEADGEIQVVGSAGNGREALELCGRLGPDVVVMDMFMPECDGIQGTRLIKTKYPFIKVLILTCFSCRENILKALSNGADGFIINEAASEELLLAIKGVNHGFGLIHNKIYSQMIHYFRGEPEKNNTPEIAEPGIAIGNLSEREREMIRHIMEGKNNRELSRIFYLSEGRVKNLITGILKKLGVKSRAQLVVYAMKHKMV